jgi:hypothetical protein
VPNSKHFNPKRNQFQISYADLLQTAAHGKTKQQQQKSSDKHLNWEKITLG